jgi:DnaJ-class molecular chaperone
MEICTTCGGRGRVFRYRGPEPCPKCGSGPTRLESAYVRLMNIDPTRPLEDKGVRNIIKAAHREGVEAERIARILDVSVMEVSDIVRR